MDRNEEILKKLQKMDRSQLQKALKSVLGNLSGEQQRQIKNITSDAQKMEQLKSKIRPQDIEALKQHMGSSAELKAYLQRADVQKRIDEIL